MLLTALSVFHDMQLVKVRPSKSTRLPKEHHRTCGPQSLLLRNSEYKELLSLNAELQVPHRGSSANLLKITRVSTAVQCRHLHAVHKHCVCCAPRVNGMVCLPPPVHSPRKVARGTRQAMPEGGRSRAGPWRRATYSAPADPSRASP